MGRRLPPVKLYSVARVEGVERQAEWATAVAGTIKRRAAAAAAAAVRREATMREIANYPPPELPALSLTELRKAACRSYNELWSARGADDKHASVDDADAFLDRISVNYLRHECSAYEAELASCYKRIGAAEARSLVRDKVLDAVATAYPWLAGECDAQRR